MEIMEKSKANVGDHVQAYNTSAYQITESQMDDPSSCLRDLMRECEEQGFFKFKLTDSWQSLVEQEYHEWANSDPIISYVSKSLEEIADNIFSWTRKKGGRMKLSTLLKVLEQQKQDVEKLAGNNEFMSSNYLRSLMHSEWKYASDIVIPIFDSGRIKQWNFNCLDSPLRWMGHPIVKGMKREPSIGIQKPTSYLSTAACFFPVHTEDLELGSLNHQIVGSTKYWLNVPPHGWKKLLDTAQHCLKEIYSTTSCKNFLRWKVHIFGREFYSENNIPVYLMQQNKGETAFIGHGIFHSGSSLDFNVNIAVNFALSQWGQYAHYSRLECECDYHKFKLPQLPFCNQMKVWCRSPWERTHEDGSITCFHPHDPSLAIWKSKKYKEQWKMNVVPFNTKRQNKCKLEVELLQELAKFLLSNNIPLRSGKALHNEFKRWCKHLVHPISMPTMNHNNFLNRIQKQLFDAFLQGENTFNLNEEESEMLKTRLKKYHRSS